MVNGRKIIVLISIKYSMVEKDDWASSKDFITNLLEKYGFKIFLLIRPFGVDEIWAISSFVDGEKMEIIEDETFVINTILLSGSTPLNEKKLKAVFTKNLPIAYLFFRKSGIPLEKVTELVSSEGGIFLLAGEVSDPRGYSHFVQITVDSGSLTELNKIIAGIIKKMKCRKWECKLGVEHEWPKGERTREKLQVTSEIAEIINDWRKAAAEGKLEKWELEEINRRFGPII